MVPLSVALAVAAGALIIYYFCFYGLNDFKSAGIVHKTPLPIFGNVARSVLRNAPICDIITEIYNLNRDAKYCGFYHLMTPTVMIRDLELLKLIITKDFSHFPNRCVATSNDVIADNNLFWLLDDKWRRTRELLIPAFSSAKLKGLFGTMSGCARNFAEYLAEQSSVQSVIEMKDACSRYTNDIIATCAFGISIDSMQNPENDVFLAGHKLTHFDRVRSIQFCLGQYYPRLTRFLGLKLLDQDAKGFFSRTIESVISTRLRNDVKRPDMIQLMLETRDKGAENGLSMEDMVAQAFAFYFAGFETVSTTLSFVTHALVSNPRVYQKLQEELDRVSETCNGNLRYEDLKELEYLEAVINETLRFRSPVPHMDRKCSEDYELPPALPGGKPYLLRKGDVVQIPLCSIHRDPKYFEDPDTFKPERFLGEGKKLASSIPFMPFGSGPRMCIGQRFAMIETKVLFFYFLTKCQLRSCARTPDPIVTTGMSFSVMVEGGLWLDVRARKKHGAPTGIRASNDIRAQS